MDEQPKPKINTGKKLETEGNRANADVMDKVLAKIKEADSVLVALSNDPTVDEIAAAMGLSMTLDSVGKHVTAIYSGKTPNVLEFLKPEDRFETGTESLQDFVIALNKDKADHLRYKIDGDFVKVYVTPYKTTISGDDIEFSRGDYNVDLVISLNVPAATELDAALTEHGRIMHDATSINITNGAAGKFGDVEWVEPSASSVSEMVAKLAFEIENKMDSVTATALLTGLVAATDRFSNPATTPEAMVLAAKLMGAGADQQLVVQNVQGEVVFNERKALDAEALGETKDETSLEISHDEQTQDDASAEVASGVQSAEAIPSETENIESERAEDEKKENDAEVAGGAVTSTAEPEAEKDLVKEAMDSALNSVGASQMPINDNTVAESEAVSNHAGQTVADQILNSIEKKESNVGSVDYGKMIDEALNEPLPGEGGIQIGQESPNGPQINTQDVEKINVSQGNAASLVGGQMMPEVNQAPQQLASSGMTEEEALNTIKQAQAKAEEALPSIDVNGELPKIIPTGGSLGYESPMEKNPAAEAAPSLEMNELNEAGVGVAVDNLMPMPEQGMTPPPVLPTPDFGAMPPMTTNVPMSAVNDALAPVTSVGTMSPEPVVMPNGMPVENMSSEPVAMPNVTVQPDMNTQITEMGLPQVQENVTTVPAETPVDPSAFKIPGIHM